MVGADPEKGSASIIVEEGERGHAPPNDHPAAVVILAPVLGATLWLLLLAALI